MGRKKEEKKNSGAAVDMEEKAGAGESVEVEILEPEKHCDYENYEPPLKVEEPEKYRILEAAFEAGESIAATAIKHGIARSTLKAWIQEKKEEGEVQAEAEDLQISQKIGNKINLLINSLTTDKLENASAKDIAVAIGILTDKRRELLGPRKGGGDVSLRIAWQNGSGAVELKTGDKE